VPAGSPGIGGFPQGHREDLRADDLLGAATTERPLRRRPLMATDTPMSQTDHRLNPRLWLSVAAAVATISLKTVACC
jgi:hypothetical protein